jgi:hypothetical protein
LIDTARIEKELRNFEREKMIKMEKMKMEQIKATVERKNWLKLKKKGFAPKPRRWV